MLLKHTSWVPIDDGMCCNCDEKCACECCDEDDCDCTCVVDAGNYGYERSEDIN